MGEARRRYAFRDGVARTTITDDNVIHILVEQDIERILGEIKTLRETKTYIGGDKHVARLPVPIYEDLKRRGIADDPDAFDRWLNSSEAAEWRIWQGMV